MGLKEAPTPEFDRALWFEHLGCRGRHYLVGNAHTVPGRMVAWCPRECCSVFVSRADIGRMSRATRYWVAGFLNGNEPPPPAGEDGPPDFGSRGYRRWQADVAKFHADGAWPARRGRR